MRELLTIVITTYNRLDLAIQTIKALKENLIYYGPLAYHIADDGSGEDYIARLVDEIGTDYPVTWTDAKRGGVGKSKNIALKMVFEKSPLVLLTEDDWVLRTPQFDVSAYCDTLISNPEVGMIRLGWLATNMATEIIGYNGITYMHLKSDSGFYVYSGQISIRHKRFYDSVGYHAEGINAGKEEEDMCQRYNKTENAPHILWPGNCAFQFQTGPFYNVGMSESLNTVMPENT